MVTIHAFRAIDNADLCTAYIREHRRVLEDFGVLQAVPSDHAWMMDPDCIVLLASHRELGLVGGIRIEHAKPGSKLPMEKSIAPFDPTIAEIIAPFAANGCGEICGLWNANRFAGHGVPLLLSMAAVSVAHQVGLKSLTCFVAHYTLRHALKVGFQILETVGDGGAFNYPVPRIKSFAMVIPDTILLEGAPSAFRERLISLRCRPIQERIESPTGLPYLVRYVLHVDAGQEDLSVYGHIASEHWRQCA
ncbi:MAG: hypothetical protein JNL43_01560 [Flavobacteriales bacterium]|nr:hypothetical protein [Flavobacteriales bacterium]HRH69757.1 hypothetical protein [Flavobacteriales bacterium]